jgi:4-amino-4-deoxy-L-arabinose transferase-like glycosyltransferase
MRVVKSSSAVFAALLVVAIASIAPGLGSATLWEPDEPRFAEATRQMFERGDFLTPYFNGVPRFEKPILLYWLQAIAYAALGPTELAARLPVAVMGIGTVLVLYLLGAAIASPRAAFVAALALATMFRFVAMSRQGLTDVPVVFFITVAMYGFVRSVTTPSRAAPWLAWSAVGLGVLTKGPVGLLPVAVWAAYAAARRDGQLVARVRPIAGAIVAMVIAVPWYAMMIVEHGRAFVDFAIGHEIVNRVMSEREFAPMRGFLYYFKVWPGDAAPWSILFIAALGWTARRWRELRTDDRRAIGLALTWFLGVFFIFSLSRSKVAHYVLPAYPAAALLIGVFIDRVAGLERAVAGRGADDFRDRWWWREPMAVVAGVVLIAAGMLGWSVDVLMPAATVAARLLLPAVLAVGGVAVALAVWRSAPIAATAALALTLAGAFAVIGAVIVPGAIEAFKPMPQLARTAARLAPPGTRIGLAGRYGASSVIFYSHHNIEWLNDDEATLTFMANHPDALCVMPSSDVERLMPRLPPSAHIVDAGEEFNVRLERLLERRRTEGRRWVLVADGGEQAGR